MNATNLPGNSKRHSEIGIFGEDVGFDTIEGEALHDPVDGGEEGAVRGVRGSITTGQ